jgi:hypothetical protein
LVSVQFFATGKNRLVFERSRPVLEGDLEADPGGE